MLATKKNILFLSSWYPNKNAPTLGNFVQKHAEAVANYNSVTVIAVFSHESKQYDIVESVQNEVNQLIVYYPKVQTKLPVIKQVLQLSRTKKALKRAYALAVNQHGKPDLVHLNVTFPLGFFAQHLKRTQHIPFVVTEHSTAYQAESTKMSNFSMRLAIQTMNEAACVLPVSEDLKRSLATRGVTTEMKIVSNVVNEKLFATYPLDSPQKTQFIHISTAIDSHKNVSGIIRTIAALSKETTNFTFKIISDGELKPFIALAYETLGIDPIILQFEGTKSTEEIAAAIHQSSALVLFSNFENFPCVIPESFMLGKPVISTAVNGIPEHVNTTNGILIDVNNEVQLRAAMLNIIDKNSSFDPVSIRAYAMEHFSYASVGKAYDSIYTEILKKHVS